jgi:C4-dicarboxylate-specific signal transduction histidine kinase
MEAFLRPAPWPKANPLPDAAVNLPPPATPAVPPSAPAFAAPRAGQAAAPRPERGPRRRLHPLKIAVVALALSGAGYFSYQLSETLSLGTLRVEASHRLDLFAAAAGGVVNRYAHLPATMELSGEVVELLHKPADAARVGAANRYLAALNQRIGSIALFVLDPAGRVLAASNWDLPDSFVGEDLSFRNYYQSAIAGQAGRHFAIGITRGDPGYYVSQPVQAEGRIIGITVIKIDLSGLRETWRSLGTPGLIADHNGVVILASAPDWLYTALAPLGPAQLAEAERTRLYNNLPIGRFPLPIDAATDEVGRVVQASRGVALTGNAIEESRRYLVQGRQLPDTGWRVLVFSDLGAVERQALTHAALAVVASAFLLLLGAFLAQRRRILRQKLEAKALLEQANAALEDTVAHRTAALTQANLQLRKEVAEREQAELTLRAAQDELVQAAKLAVLGQLATGITHELTQPLGAIRTLAGNALAFQQRGELATSEKNLGIIARLADQMGGIIAPLKTFARKSPAIPAAVDVAHAVGNALFLLDQRLQRAGVEVDNRCHPGAAIAWCDQNRLEQVLVNLIGNAADAMAQAPRRVLTLSAGPGADGGLVLSAADSGPGLPEALRARLFEPFFTTKPAGEGLGLGLAISRDIMRDFGGDLTAAEAPGGGACFHVHLPRPPAPEQP